MPLRAPLLISLCSLAALAPATTAAPSARADRDRDGMADRWEKRHRVSNPFLDADRDGVDNGNEARERTSPRKRDSDRDRVPDGREDADNDGLNNRLEDVTGNDPMDKDTDDDGVRDGRESAGTVTSFKNGVLVIRPAKGRPVRAKVTDTTVVVCDSEKSFEDTQTGRSGHSARVSADTDRDDDPAERGRGGDGDAPDVDLDVDLPGDLPGVDLDVSSDDQPLDTSGDSQGEGPADEDEPREADCRNRLRKGVPVHEAALTITPTGLDFDFVEVVVG